ncbi:MAG: alpha-1,4-glucan--maltose-1-phosphate maltosyltransferase, partial [Thermodesulfobacteriota bacterium]
AGDRVRVRADIFSDGHDLLCARLWHRKKGESDWQRFSMQPMINDIWEGWFTVTELGFYEYTVSAWVDHFGTWQADLQKKFAAGQDVRVEFSVGLHMMQKVLEQAREGDALRLGQLLQNIKEEQDESLAVGLASSPELGLLMEDYQERGLATEYPRILQVEVDRKKAGCSAWYEIFPRSWGYTPGEHGTFKECERVLPDIAEMGFDVLYLPPIHPIGWTKRKGKNNSPLSEPGDPGSPWAIGSEEGGHKAVHPELGTLDDFREFLSKAREHGLEIALDLAFQCSNDHPYLREHPQWFRWRPDGSVQFAENPPKKYEDIVPLDFETEDWPALWQELKSVVVFWIEQGVFIFRVDNPHTKPFAFWEWLIGEVKNEYPEVVFLSEAFTRPKVMYRLAKLGFTQSYTYFAWRNSRQELTEYIEELTKAGPADFFRPNFWPNTPDILPEILQYGGRPAFVIRLALAATLSSNYGIYGPAFELCVADPVPGKEEYLNSEKYEIKDWKWDQAGNLKDFITRMNHIRQENPALQATNNLEFQECDNPNILVYSKYDEETSNYLLIAVNLDPFHNQAGWIRVPLEQLGIAEGKPYLLMDLVGDEKHVWTEEWNRIELNPHISPVQIFHIHAHLRTENDFDYFM